MNGAGEKTLAASGLVGFFQGARGKILQHSKLNKTKWSAMLNGILVLTGICGMLVVISYDFFKEGPPQFGDRQLAGFAICTIITLAGLNRIIIFRARVLELSVLLIYLAGILFFGLRPKALEVHSTGMLGDTNFSFSDLTTNILGFIPLGCMLTNLLSSARRIKGRVVIILIAASACFCLSLLIEVSQAFIPGRASSALDLVYNGLGALLGIGYYFLATKAINQK